MSLAAALERDGVRPVSSLPTIKCTNCGDEIDIIQIGDHVCGSSMPPELISKGHTSNKSNPFTLRLGDASGRQPTTTTSPFQQPDTGAHARARSSTLSSTFSVAPKPSRPTLSRIDSEIANKSFRSPRQGTVDLPLSPAASATPGRNNSSNLAFPHSATGPAPRQVALGPPSPELSANLDCAFPPFPNPTSLDRRPSTSSERKTPTGNEWLPPRGGSRLDQVLTAEPDHLTMEPRSPRPNGGENVLQKMATLKAGPFNSQRRGSEDPKDLASTETPRRPSGSGASDSRGLSTAASSHSPIESGQALQKIPPPRPTRPTEEVLSPSFLGQFSAEPSSLIISASQEAEIVRPAERSHTFPLRDASMDEHASGRSVSTMRSEPVLHPQDRRPSAPQTSSVKSPSFPNQHILPPRKDSMAHPRVDHRIQDAPPVPRGVQQYKQEGTHTPSDSGSSIASMTNSSPHSKVSGTSPIGSVASSVDNFSPLSFGSSEYGRDDRMRVADLNVKNPMAPGMRAEQPRQRSPPRTFIRPDHPREIPRRTESISITPLESPMDPALHHVQQRLESPGPESARPALGRTQTATGPIPRARPAPPALTLSARSDQASGPTQLELVSQHLRSPSMALPPPSPRHPSPNSLQPPSADSHTTKAPSRRPTTSKPVCRGCGQAIQGKSVKAADGRLTGRWHKACFVCRSCRAPFTTADFYVIDNEPYCEQHYHEENGSLCNGCNRGIEGQYLETSSSTRYGSIDRKFHPKCFTCTTCRVVLAQDYFEITGRVYCERHALAAMRAQAGMGTGLNFPDRRGLLAERRTTRLINPMMA